MRSGINPDATLQHVQLESRVRQTIARESTASRVRWHVTKMVLGEDATQDWHKLAIFQQVWMAQVSWTQCQRA